MKLPFRPLSGPALVCLLLALAAFVVYFPVTSYGFVDYDDSGYFFANPHVLGGLAWANVKWAFTSGQYANWHPLTWLSLMLDATLFGNSAAAPHFTNVLLHAANSILLFLLLLRAAGAFWRSAIVAALFALHPLHVESVAWVAERKDVLSAFFGLLSLLCYASYVKNSRDSSLFTLHSSPSYGLALLLFACSLMSKPMLVTLPFVMLLLDYWPLQRFAVAPKPPASERGNASTLLRLLLEKIPFFLLTAASSVVTFIVQQKGGAVSSLSRFSFTERVDNAFVAYARYLAKIVWPVDLSVIYPHPGYGPIWIVALSVLLFAVLCLAALALKKKFPFAFTGWFWFAGTLVPVIGLVQVGQQAMADRYAYLPLIGILIVAVWGAGELCAKWQPPRRAVIGFVVILLFAVALRARNQVVVWQNDETLFDHALAVTKNNYVAELDLGYWYSKMRQPQRALRYYYTAWRMSPNDPDALYDVGNAFAKLGDWDDAIRNYRRALQIAPNQPDVMDNLGFALAQMKHFSEAVSNFQAVLKINPASFGAHNNLATIFFIQGNYREAAGEYKAALQLSPDNPLVLVNLGDALVRLGQTNNAAQCYQRALQLQPDNETVRDKLQSLGATHEQR